MGHDRQHPVRFGFRKCGVAALAVVAALTLAACGSASGTSKTNPGQSPTATTAPSSGGYNY